MTTPLVSVVMSAYNAENYIADSIRSVLKVEGLQVELIVIDDGSTDGTADILAAFSDPRLRVVTHRRNMRLASSLNEGVSLARGTFVARLDADDLCHPRRLARQVAFLERHPEVTVVGGDAVAIGGAKGLLKYPRSHDAIKAQLLFANAMSHPTIMFRKECVPEWYDPEMVAGQDYELWSRLVWRVGFANMAIPAIWYRFHRGQSSNQLGPHQRDAARRARKAMAAPLTLDWSADDWDLYLLACEGIQALSADELSRLFGLHRSLRTSNRRIRAFDRAALRRASSRALAATAALAIRSGSVEWRALARGGVLLPLLGQPRLLAWALRGSVRNSVCESWRFHQ